MRITPDHVIDMDPPVGLQFAYAIASSQAPGGPLAYTLQGKHSSLRLLAAACNL